MPLQTAIIDSLLTHIESTFGADTIVEEPESVGQLGENKGTLITEDYDPAPLDFRQELVTHTFVLMFKRRGSIDNSQASRDEMMDDLEAVRTLIRADDYLSASVDRATVSEIAVQSLKGSTDIIGLMRFEIEVLF